MEYFKQALDDLKSQNNYRTLKIIQTSQMPRILLDGKEYIMLASSNYLGLSSHPKLIQAAKDGADEFGVGSGGSRLITGTMSLHEGLEYALTRFMETEDTILFNSGYDANLGVISTIMDSDDIIFSDELNHASIIDGCQLSKAKTIVYNHNDMSDLEKRMKENITNSTRLSKKLIVTDTVFSMDGDLADLKSICDLAEEYDALVMVDEAHALGVFGDHGRGVGEYQGVEDRLTIKMGALSKALGTTGGFISGSEELVDYLRNRARSFVFTTSLPPSVLSSSIASIELLRSEPELRENLWKNIEYWRTGLQEIGCNTLSSSSQIVPIMTGSAKDTLDFSQYLFNSGIFVTGIRPPTVPAGKCRLRTTVMANHTQEDLKHAIDIIQDYCERMKKEENNSIS